MEYRTLRVASIIFTFNNDFDLQSFHLRNFFDPTETSTLLAKRISMAFQNWQSILPWTYHMLIIMSSVTSSTDVHNHIITKSFGLSQLWDPGKIDKNNCNFAKYIANYLKLSVYINPLIKCFFMVGSLVFLFP